MDLPVNSCVSHLPRPGNCFGEDGCQQLRDFMESKGKSDILGSLDEDEGSESEDDDGDDSEDDSDNSDRGEREGGDGDHMKEDKDGVAKESSSKSEPAPTEENELGEVSVLSSTR